MKSKNFSLNLSNQEIFLTFSLLINNIKNIFSLLITISPNKFIKPIHYRMPVILKIKDGLNYLIDDADTNLTRCIPYTGKMAMEPASI